MTMAVNEMRLVRPVRVKNKTPAEIQITAEQILREARELQDAEIRLPKQKIADAEELAEYRCGKRKEFEDRIKQNPKNTSVFVKYAHWEESQKDFRRARSVWERVVLKVDHRNSTLWLKYAEMEMKHRFVNEARNVFDKAVLLLPRADRLWLEYIRMEEMLGNVARARQIFERWMLWKPEHPGWIAYFKFELRYSEIERGRAIYERYVQCHPTVKAWLGYAKFEAKHGEVAKARSCYERAYEHLGEDGETEELFVAFAQFETKLKEVERARAIYRYALDHLSKGQAEDLYKEFVQFEKQYGGREDVEDIILSKKRFQYENEVKSNPLGYDAWFDYARLEESFGRKEKIRDVYERAITCLPPTEGKRYWQRYIYLWISYALYEELEAVDVERAREVYRECLKIIPHKRFSFAKIWSMAAQFEIRQLNLTGARKVLGTAIGIAPKEKIFRTYIDLELQLGNIERCRTLYGKYLDWSPANCNGWTNYAEMERSLGEIERGRAIFDLAITQPELEMPELLWKAYIEFEIAEREYERARRLYEKLLDRTTHLKVWVSYAKFEATFPLEEETRAQAEDRSPSGSLLAEQGEERCIRSRRVFQRALESFRESAPDRKEERALLLEEWRGMERSFGQFGDVASVQKEMPRRVKRKRPILSHDAKPAGFEEYVDYMYPEETDVVGLRILEAAYQWKRQKVATDVTNSEG